MVSNDITRRDIMKGVGVVTSARLVSGRSSACRDTPNKQVEDFTQPVVDDGKHDTWPQSGGTAAQMGRRPGSIGPKSTVVYRWRVDGVVSGLAVANDLVYASDETVLRALSAEDGTEVWTETASDDHSYRATAMSTPAVDSTLIYVGETRKRVIDSAADNGSVGCSRVRALDATTGEPVWQFKPKRTVSRFYSPTVADGIVYVIGRNFGAGSVGLLHALDGTTGDPVWNRETGTSGITGYEAPPVAVENGVVYLAADELLALDAQTGETYWSSDAIGRRTYRATGKNAPAVAHGRIYVGHGTRPTFEARHIADGSYAWTHTLTTDLDQQTGKRIETKSESRSEMGVWTGTAVDDDTAYVGFNSLSHRFATAVYAFAVNDGSIRWRTTFSNPVHTPAIADGVLYTGRAALSCDDGSILWRLDAPTNTHNQNITLPSSHPRFSSPAIADETVYVGGTILRAITGR